MAVEFHTVEGADVRHVVDWRDHAMCKGRTELFFAKNAERPQARDRREARARQLCTACPVQTICRTWARDHHEYGYWGGENEETRHLLGFTISAPIGARARQSGASAAG